MLKSHTELSAQPTGVGFFERILAEVHDRFDRIDARLSELEKTTSTVAEAVLRPVPSVDMAVQTDEVPADDEEDDFVPGVGFGFTVLRPRGSRSSFKPPQPHVSMSRTRSSSSLEVNVSEAPGSVAAPRSMGSPPAVRRHPAALRSAPAPGSDSSAPPLSSEDDVPAARPRRPQRVRRPKATASPAPVPSPAPAAEEAPGQWGPRPGARRQSVEERERRMRSGLCLYCASNKHIKLNCPVRPERPDYFRSVD